MSVQTQVYREDMSGEDMTRLPAKSLSQALSLAIRAILHEDRNSHMGEKTIIVFRINEKLSVSFLASDLQVYDDEYGSVYYDILTKESAKEYRKHILSLLEESKTS